MNVCDNLGDHLVGNVYVKVKNYYLIKEDINPVIVLVFAEVRRYYNNYWAKVIRGFFLYKIH